MQCHYLVASPIGRINLWIFINQISSWYRDQKHSLFTYYFLKALQGDADFLTNVYINQYSIAEMELNIINWLSELGFKGGY